MNSKPTGHKAWAIAEGRIPSYGHGPEPEPAFTSHETACVLNTADLDLRIWVYFSDRNPVGPYNETLPDRRTKPIRFNDLKVPEPVPTGTDFASIVESDMPVVVQHTCLHSRQAENALLSTMAFPVNA